MITLTAAQAASVARFATRADADAAADAAGLPRSAVGEAALFSLRFFVIRGHGEPMTPAMLAEAAFVFGRCGKTPPEQGIRGVWDRVWDTMEEVPFSRFSCGPCHVAGRRAQYYNIRGECPECGHGIGAAVRPFAFSNEEMDARGAADFFSGRYRCAYAVIPSSLEHYKILPQAMVPAGVQPLYVTEEPC